MDWMKMKYLMFSYLLLSSALHAQMEQINSPVQDAKQAYSKGVIEFVGIQLQDELLLPGIKPELQKSIRQNYKIRSINRRWKTRPGIEQDPKRLFQLKRYANRYNLTIHKLLKAEKLEQKLRYRY
jgi:hypothetical protein